MELGQSGRERFILDACAQHAITTSQIWWTYDVYQAFERLEQARPRPTTPYFDRDRTATDRDWTVTGPRLDRDRP